MTSNYFNHSIQQLLMAIENKTIDPQLIIDKAVEQDKKFKKNNIFIHNNLNNLTISSSKKPLSNIIIAIKDNIVTEDMATTCASNILKEYNNFGYDATLIKDLKNAGALIAGKVNLDEFAMGSFGNYSAFGITINPWVDNDGNQYASGGSSSGSAAVVAAGIAHIAIGTDTGGSVLYPAACCGVVGFKPTYGAISRYGVIPMANGLDTVGLIGKNVQDIQWVFDILCHQDIKDASSIDLKALSQKKPFNNTKKIAIIKEFNDCPDIFPTMNKVKNYLEKLGYILEEISVPAVEYGLSLYNNIVPMEVMSNMARYDGLRYGLKLDNNDGYPDYVTATRSEGFGDEVKRRIILGAYMASQVFSQDRAINAYGVKHWMADQFGEIFKQYDFILKPTSFSHAVAIKNIKNLDPISVVKTDKYTVIANLIGSPAIHIPIDLYPNGMPLGISLMADSLQDYHLLNLANAVDNNFQFSSILINNFNKNL